MGQLSFQPRHVAGVLNGSKPFTLRKVRRDGHCPKVGTALHLFTNHRQPNMAKIGTTTCAMRVTLWFDERGIAKVQHDGMDTAGPPILAHVAQAIVDAGSLDVKVQELGLHRLAVWDGFASWSELVAWHVGNAGVDANGHCLRRLIGFGTVTPDPDYVSAHGVQEVLPS